MPAYKVDWENVFDGEEHILTEGEHFKTITSFSKYVYNKAKIHGKKIYPPKILADSKSVIVQARPHEAILGNSGKLVVRENKTILPEIVDAREVKLKENSNVSIVLPEEEHIWREWFSRLFLGGQKEVEELKLDEFGNRIPIYWVAKDGFKYMTGEYEKEKKIITFTPDEHVEIKLPNGLPDSILHRYPTISARKFAGIFLLVARKVAENVKGVDVDDLYFNYDKPGFLRIYYGNLAEKQREKEEEEYQLKLFEKKIMAKTVSIRQLEKWVEGLGFDEKDENGNLVGWLKLEYGRDYYSPKQRMYLISAIQEIAKQKGVRIETIIPEGKIGDSDKYGVTLSLRKSQDGRFQQFINKNETARETMDRHKELGYGQIVEQPYIEQRKEIEEQKRLDHPDYDKKQLLLEIETLEKAIQNAKTAGVKKALEGKLEEAKHRFAEERKLLP